ncbi:MAG TPA: 4-hydroxybenzoyl-CoA reductase, partial [Sorangium sp.]|nr:4-hydroxybenzoyl-CoA reductase [Sorangium sp.]
MLPLPRFDHHRPRTVDEAMALMARFGERARFIAGGTDMLPNMKHGLVAPQQLVSLRNIEALRGVRREADHIVVGAMTSLDVVANHPEVRRYAAALAQACAAVGGPHHRRMGTLGGNVCLDTRCVYYNQTHFWRQALGYCL